MPLVPVSFPFYDDSFLRAFFSTNLAFPASCPIANFFARPNLDDDGSGSMTILEAFRVLLTDERVAAGQAPNTIEFHWYSAEEGGLLGSQAIFQSYAKAGRDVKAMLQQDMTGYVGTGKKDQMGLIVDNVDDALTNFIRLVLDAVSSRPLSQPPRQIWRGGLWLPWRGFRRRGFY